MHTNPEVLALVALGESDAATAEDLAHIAHCDVCGQEVTELGHLTRVGRTISDHYTLETPSPQVWDKIRAQLGFRDDFSSALVPAVSPRTPATPESPPVVATPPVDIAAQVRIDPPPHRKRRLVGLALAVVLALLAGIGGTLAWQQLKPLTETVIASTPLDALPDWSGATGEATLEQDPSGRQVLVVSMVTPRPVDGIQQVWVIGRDQTSMISLGNLTAPIDRFTLPAALDIADFPVVDVSAEPPDGDQVHSGNSIVRGTLNV